ncbi:MAG TPA: toll/interleukin-1 receptor domain-containing protein [Pyrinomonadaceae bacterium]|jgi:hypothetical protein|nr:toll/interleukin-1 receptor domain-containing protein [Pyrinomonadaceae bacterium]
MPKPLVFISHSAKEPLAKEVLEQLRVKLEPDFEVLLDKYRLEANDPWRRELVTWMSLCHVAVILFSKRALKAPWVLQEATILKWRRVSDKNFVVIPVLIPPVKPKNLENKMFAPLALNEIQMLTGDKASDIVDRILKRLEPLKEQGEVRAGLQWLEEKIISNLSGLETINPQALVQAAAKLGLTMPWKSDSGYSKQLARALLSAEFSQVAEAILVLTPHLQDYGKGVEILDRLSPFWVDPQAAARLPEMSALPQQQRAVCVNGANHDFTPRCYLSRARADIYPWLTATITRPDGLEEGDQQMKSIEEEVVRQFAKPFDLGEVAVEDFFTGQADKFVEAIEETDPLFIIIPRGVDEDLVERLRKRFVRFTFFMLNDDQTLDAAKLKLRNIELLEPKLDPSVEASNAKTYYLTRIKLNSLKPK